MGLNRFLVQKIWREKPQNGEKKSVCLDLVDRKRKSASGKKPLADLLFVSMWHKKDGFTVLIGRFELSKL